MLNWDEKLFGVCSCFTDPDTTFHKYVSNCTNIRCKAQTLNTLLSRFKAPTMTEFTIALLMVGVFTSDDIYYCLNYAFKLRRDEVSNLLYRVKQQLKKEGWIIYSGDDNALKIRK